MREEITIDDIKSLKNIRTEIGDVSELMSSIRENGLIHPITITKIGNEYILVCGHRRFSALKKLGRKALEIGKEVLIIDKVSDIDLLVLNIVENYHTKPDTPLELASACSRLKELGLSIGEISVRLSIPKTKIVVVMGLLKGVPEKEKKNLTNLYGAEAKKGKLSATVASAMAYCKTRYGMNDKEVEILFEEARKNEFSTRDIRIISLLMEEGMKIKEAIKNKEFYTNKQVDFIVKKEELEKIKQPFSVFVKKILREKERNLFF